MGAFHTSIAVRRGQAHRYPGAADKSKLNYGMTLLILCIMVLYVTTVCGPIAVALMTLVVGALFLRDNKDRDIHYN